VIGNKLDINKRFRNQEAISVEAGPFPDGSALLGFSRTQTRNRVVTMFRGGTALISQSCRRKS